jgi:small subunit ribosomal protein S17
MTVARSTGRRKSLVGVVVSDKMDKTVVVRVERLVRHDKYGKMIRRRRKFKAHDEENRCRIGDTVAIVESRPVSKEKHWRVVEILKRAAV